MPADGNPAISAGRYSRDDGSQRSDRSDCSWVAIQAVDCGILAAAGLVYLVVRLGLHHGGTKSTNVWRTNATAQIQ